MDGSFDGLKSNEALLAYLTGLRRESGGFADSNEGSSSLRATLSVVKASLELGVSIHDQSIISFIQACHNDRGGFSIEPGSEATAYDTAVALITLKSLGSRLADTYLPSALNYMKGQAKTQFDYFMMIAAYEECHIEEAVPDTGIQFFWTLLEKSLEQGLVTNTAIAASALMRAGLDLSQKDQIISLLLKGQETVEGGFGDGEEASLFATYCVMRALVLLKVLPNMKSLLGYLDSLETQMGYSDSKKGKTSAGAIYQNVSMRTWLKELQEIPVKCAGEGKLEGLKEWLLKGGLINHYDLQGWNPLLMASARGESQVVDLLLNHQLEGVERADAKLRFIEADALPLYMAGQSGDLETVKLLLKADPESLHTISQVNGHTVLLQAAFYGKEKHLILAKYLLENAAEISGLSEDKLEEEQIRLLSATNVRGYNAITMQDLWHNEQMKTLLMTFAYDLDASDAYYKALMIKIASPQALTERIMEAIADYIAGEEIFVSEQVIDQLLSLPNFNINGLGGPLQMTPLIFALTGVDVGNVDRGLRRYHLTKKLLEAGADPTIREKHPMAVGPVIRASVLNNFGLLQLLANYMSEEAFRQEMNVSPAVNGLTAMHDAVHRALTSPVDELEGHLQQIKWMIERGASIDLPDHTGQSVRELTKAAQDDSAFALKNVTEVFNIIKNH